MKAGSAQQTGAYRVGVILLTLATAIIHLVILNFMLLQDPQFGKISIPFTLNGIGYLGLLAALYLPISFLQGRRGLVRWALVGFTGVTILAWLAMGDKSMSGLGVLGYLTQIIQIALIGLLILENRSN
jgi:hypothetical protein